MSVLLSNPERVFWLGLMAAVGWAAQSFSAPASLASAPPEDGGKRPVLVELFTSEGCSSCPPADALLARLDSTQPIAGAQVIVLSEHVTYWNQLGWRDPFSSEAMTERQRRYGEQFGLSDVYTPQAVVDGAAELVGSDEHGLAKAIARAASAPKQQLTLADVQSYGGAVHFLVRGAASSNTLLMAALAEDSVQSSVARGENEGRTLRHVAVVRALQQMGKGVDDGRPLALKLPQSNQTGPMRLIVFLTSRDNGHVLAVSEQAIAR